MEQSSCFLVLLGGTGVKCGEIFLHMCANGYFSGDEVNILYIDSDLYNGNAENFEHVYEHYSKCREKYRISESPIPCFFRTKVNYYKSKPVDGNIKYFSDMASISGGASGTEAINLMKVLYSDQEMEMQISDGFFAHPNVGAAVFAANMDKIMEALLHQICIEQGLMKNIKIFILGSIFGGTGASSLPIISRYLKQKLFGESDNQLIQEQMKIGGCMILPYFLFTRKDENGNVVSDSGVAVEADKFATKTRSALEYYKDVDREDGKSTFDSLYILGHDGGDVRGIYATAGCGQRNLPHVTELYAAMSCVHFFDSGMGERKRYFAAVPQEKIGWQDVFTSGSGFYNFLTMMRFSMVMKSLILEELFDYTKANKVKDKAKKIPWYYDFLNGKAPSSDMDTGKLYEKFEAISQYCDDYIRWFAQLNLGNVYKIKHPEMAEFERPEGGGSDMVEYLNLFSKKLLLKQYTNNLIWSGNIDLDREEAEEYYQQNLRYIRDHFNELELVHFYTDMKTEQISMEKIWSRLSYIGYSSLVIEEDVFKNIAMAQDKSMDSGVKNLVNAVYCACLI